MTLTPEGSMQGRRVTEAQLYDPDYTLPGDYAPYERGGWIVRDPGGRMGWLHPSKHVVTEHDDGTISVMPSVLRTPDEDRSAAEMMGADDPDTPGRPVGEIQSAPGSEGWHGWLERGVWRSV